VPAGLAALGQGHVAADLQCSVGLVEIVGLAHQPVPEALSALANGVGSPNESITATGR